jgi:4a-hydroxytetrahydrobiopterin dehydratase
MARLSQQDIQTRLQALPGWELSGEAIHGRLTFPGFPQAIAFVVRLAFAAEAVDHHPDITVSYKRVSLTYSTHSEGGLTAKDFDGAREANTIAAQMAGE